jgi:hypothetical protein
LAEKKPTITEAPQPAGPYTEPREKADPAHRDAGQIAADEHNQRQQERDQAEQERRRQIEQDEQANS